MSADLKIKVRGLTKAFGPKVVLNGVDLDVPSGEFVAYGALTLVALQAGVELLDL